jgi:protein Tex
MTDSSPTPLPFDPTPLLVNELQLPRASIAAVIKLLDEGSTVPFIARYRKEMTGSLDEVQIRAIEERRTYIVELDKRRQTIIESIKEQGKLSAPLLSQLLSSSSKAELEDLYLPFKPKRRTRATTARERGLSPLADLILSQPSSGNPLSDASPFVSDDVPSPEDALQGARDIAAETIADRADVRALIRQYLTEKSELVSEVLPEFEGKQSKFEQYYSYREPLSQMPSHRYLAVRRGEREKVLKLSLLTDHDAAITDITSLCGIQIDSPYAPQLRTAIEDSYHRLIAPSVETEVRVNVKLTADTSAVDVFASNLRHILLAAPLGSRSVIGVDPGIRSGCKCVAISETSKFLDHTTIYIHERNPERLAQASQSISDFISKHQPIAVAVGNGTFGRETEAFIRQALSQFPPQNLPTPPIVISVSESGASVYSASDIARIEFPDLDLTLRGAISIARRLQDPLAELVKLDPKAIGVGQYQHDVHQPLLQRKLSDVVESCVNLVGVDLNTASPSLLSYVAGIGPKLAQKITQYREANGLFTSRQQLLDVPGVGPRTFQQAAGFLRIQNPQNPLDASAVHPERYPLVERIAQDLNIPLPQLVGNADAAQRIDIPSYTSPDVGEPTLRDIIDELCKPGRDPRQQFDPLLFRDDVMTLNDLKDNMILEGVITNVTDFGAFVDIGVHQDGLIHISQLAPHFISNPHTFVKPGDRIKVKVLSIDIPRQRISLSARLDDPQPKTDQPKSDRPPSDRRPSNDRPSNRSSNDRPSNDRRPSGDRRPSNDRRPPSPPSQSTDKPSSLTYNPFAALKK